MSVSKPNSQPQPPLEIFRSAAAHLDSWLVEYLDFLGNLGRGDSVANWLVVLAESNIGKGNQSYSCPNKWPGSLRDINRSAGVV